MADRPRPSLAEVVRRFGSREAVQARLPWAQRKVCRAIAQCRTAALGGHLMVCSGCGGVRFVYHACRNRHCPRCQTRKKEQWLAARAAELLPVPYFHLVLTLPHGIHRLLPTHARWVYDTLFACASSTLLDFGRDPARLGGRIGLTLVLHTWAQDLTRHVHVHGVVTGGALRDDGTWASGRRSFLFPVRALSTVFRARYLDALRQAQASGEFASSTWTQDPKTWSAWLADLRKPDWVVYAKPPFGGPQQVLDYLGRYTHRVAIHDARLVDIDDQSVRFKVRDRHQPNSPRRRILKLAGEDFLQRFLLHVLPNGFQRLRHYGITASRSKHQHLAQCRAQLQVAEPEPRPVETLEAFWLRVAGIDIHVCPDCGGPIVRMPLLPLPRGPPP